MEKFVKIELLLDNMFKSITSEISEQKGSLFCIYLKNFVIKKSVKRSLDELYQQVKAFYATLPLWTFWNSKPLWN